MLVGRDPCFLLNSNVHRLLQTKKNAIGWTGWIGWIDRNVWCCSQKPHVPVHVQDEVEVFASRNGKGKQACPTSPVTKGTSSMRMLTGSNRQPLFGVMPMLRWHLTGRTGEREHQQSFEPTMKNQAVIFGVVVVDKET